jgi:CRISPR-associated protein Cas2
MGYLGGFRRMWIAVMFDLPVDTKQARKEYTRFRKKLLNNGYLMLQYSVYARPCPSLENAEVHKKRIKEHVPPNGNVRIVFFTDKQFEKMEVFYGKRQIEPEKQPEQLSFF